MSLSLVYDFRPVTLLACAADAAGRTGQWINLRNAKKIAIVCEVNQGNAATVALNVLQATSNAGAGAKAIGGVEATPLHVYLNNLAAGAGAADGFADLGYLASYTTDATLADKLVVFEFVPEAALDIPNGFTHVTVQTGASNAANITSARAHLVPGYAGASAPNALV